MTTPANAPCVAVVHARRPQCPYCGATRRLRQYGKSRNGQILYYECKNCVYPDGSGAWTKFEVLMENPHKP